MNESRNRHWRTSDRLTRECADFLACYRNLCGCPMADYGGDRTKRKVQIAVYKTGTPPDPSNLLKHLLDGMKMARLIVDDSAKWCDCQMPAVVRVLSEREVKTVITLTNVREPANVALALGLLCSDDQSVS